VISFLATVVFWMYIARCGYIVMLFAVNYRSARSPRQRGKAYPYERDITYQSFLTLPLLLFGFSKIYQRQEEDPLFSRKYPSVAFLYALTLAKVTANLIVNLQLVLSDSEDLASLPLIRGAIYMGFLQGFLSLGIYFRGKLSSGNRQDSLDEDDDDEGCLQLDRDSLTQPFLADDQGNGNCFEGSGEDAAASVALPPLPPRAPLIPEEGAAAAAGAADLAIASVLLPGTPHTPGETVQLPSFGESTGTVARAPARTQFSSSSAANLRKHRPGDLVGKTVRVFQGPSDEGRVGVILDIQTKLGSSTKHKVEFEDSSGQPEFVLLQKEINGSQHGKGFRFHVLEV
jgi:hypothetical protein